MLVIDDHTPDRYIVRKSVERYTDTILEAVNGADGVSAARVARPSVIFLDLGLPDTPGEEILKELRRLPETRNIPVVINSSKPLTPAEIDDLRQNATAVLSKSMPHTERTRLIAEIFNDIDIRRKAATHA